MNLNILLQMDLYGSIALLLVFAFRKLMGRLPKRTVCVMWLVAAIRLVCPYNFNSFFSIMNLRDIAPAATAQVPDVIRKVTVTETVVEQRVTPGQIIFWVWLTVAVLIVVVSLIRVAIPEMKLRRNCRAMNGYFEVDGIETSFVTGFIFQRIYMPSGVTGTEKEMMLSHERQHVRNRDNLSKLMGMIVLAIHWFNPIVWIAFGLMCSDLEMRCDEDVVKEMGKDVVPEYCVSLVQQASEAKISCSLDSAFAKKSELKTRVQNIINYKKRSALTCVVYTLLAIAMIFVFTGIEKVDEQIVQINALDMPIPVAGVDPVSSRYDPLATIKSYAGRFDNAQIYDKDDEAVMIGTVNIDGIDYNAVARTGIDFDSLEIFDETISSDMPSEIITKIGSLPEGVEVTEEHEYGYTKEVYDEDGNLIEKIDYVTEDRVLIKNVPNG